MTVTLTVPSVLSALYAQDTVSQQPRVKRKFLQTRTPTPFEKMPGRLLWHLSSSKRSIRVSSEAWAAPNLVSKACRNPSCPAHLLFPPAINQHWFLRRSMWLTTGWRMIWKKSSQRKRGGLERRTVACLQQQEVKTGTSPILSPEVMTI